MNTKYMSFIKKSIICLVILLVVVCFSLSSSFSSFIYESNNHRAVEMIANKLSYSIKINNIETNKITVKPGNNIINIKIKSLNQVETYYKLLYENNENLNIYTLNNVDGKINSMEELDIKLLIINNSNDNVNSTFSVSGGYITRNLEEVIVFNNYNEIKNSLLIGNRVEYNPNNSYEVEGKYFSQNDNIIFVSIPTNWVIYDINENGEVLITSENEIVLDNSLKINGAFGYNNAVNLLNDISKNLYSSEYSLDCRNMNLEDIEKKYNKKLVTYGENYEFLRSLTNVSYPTLWEYEKYSIIDGESKNGEVLRSEAYYINESDNKKANQVVIKDAIINEEKIDNGNYLLSTRYVKPFNSSINWGIYSIKDGKLYLNPLFDISAKEYEIPFSIKPIIKLSIDYFTK